MRRPSRDHGRLGSPPDAAWPDPGDRDPDPFVAFRSLLWSYDAARRAGMADGGFVDLVRRLDDAVGEVDGRGFRHSPFAEHPALADAVGQTGGVWAKDETGNVSGSHKARHLFGLALHLEVDQVPRDTLLAIASCGNAALGAAVVARAAGRPLAVHVPPWADAAVLDRLADLGADVRICERRAGDVGDPCVLRAREAVAAGARTFGCQAVDDPLTIDGGRTLGFELAADLADRGVEPDRLLVQVGGGALAASVVQGLTEAVALGGLAGRPALNTVQAEGCAPLARAFNRVADADDPDAALFDHGADHMWPWDGPTSAATGILDDITYDWVPLVHDMLTGDPRGGPIVAAEADVVAAHLAARAHTTVPADPTGTAGLAGLLATRRDGCIASDETVVVLFTGVDRS